MRNQWRVRSEFLRIQEKSFRAMVRFAEDDGMLADFQGTLKSC